MNQSRLCRLFCILPWFGLAACNRGGGQPHESDSVPAHPIVDVRIDTVRTGSIPELLHATGRTLALRQENVSSPVDGKVNALRVLEGDHVRAGEVIAVVETKESLAALTGAQLLLSRAHTDEERQRALADVERARRNDTTLEIAAPFDGVVANRSLNQGEFVAAGGALVTLVDLQSLCFVARLPARDLPRVRLRQVAHVSIDGSPSKAYRCEVDNIKPQIDPAAQMAEVRLRFVEPVADLRADMFGTAEIVASLHPGVLLAPDTAVLRDDETGRHTIVEAVGDSIGIARPVQIGIETPDLVEIQGAGLRPGMHVIVEGHYGLPDSTHIHVQAAPTYSEDASSPVESLAAPGDATPPRPAATPSPSDAQDRHAH